MTVAERRPRAPVWATRNVVEGRQPNERSEAGAAQPWRPVGLVAAAPSLRCGLPSGWSADDGALVAVVDAGGRVAGRSGGRAVLFIVFKVKSRQQRCSRQHLALEGLVNGVNLS